MDITIQPKKLSGSIDAIPSKSQAHRLLICAAFADRPTRLNCRETNQDIEATADCLRALGANIRREDFGYCVTPAGSLPESAILNCHESGSTLRFLLPVAGALGVKTTFQMAGRLPQRPLSPMWEEMERMGCRLCRPSKDTILCEGQLKSGTYTIPGSVSSQFITGFLLATSLLDGDSQIHITGKLESALYVSMTRHAMSLFGVKTEAFFVKGRQKYRTPGSISVEGDWSNAAFFLAARALGNDVTVHGIQEDSLQGDRAVAELLPALENRVTISAANIPDLVPILAVTAAAKKGAVFTDIQRLRLKESDRIASTVAMLNAFGIHADAGDSILTVWPGSFTGGTVDSFNDHRIAMAAAVGATVARGPVTILGAQCVQKSYPHFWEEYSKLGGQYEQYLR